MFTRHPDYIDSSALGWPNDIAVLGFAAVSFNGNLQAITLSTPSDGNYAGDQCTITGWGRTSGGGPIPVTLQQATMTIMTNAACANEWGSASINDGHICITDATSASCSGDSGGPLECGNKLAGATSWGQSNCNPSFPSVYSRVSEFYTWIQQQ
jgi:secreted trypsin-like serine protease